MSLKNPVSRLSLTSNNRKNSVTVQTLYKTTITIVENVQICIPTIENYLQTVANVLQHQKYSVPI